VTTSTLHNKNGGFGRSCRILLFKVYIPMGQMPCILLYDGRPELIVTENVTERYYSKKEDVTLTRLWDKYQCLQRLLSSVLAECIAGKPRLLRPI
jgi:hypothetical protein